MMLRTVLWACVCCAGLSSATEPNPPVWPDSVYVFSPKDPAHTQDVVQRIFTENGGHIPPWHGQFSDSRYALLFLPGEHEVDVRVGYYTSVIGLGKTPSVTTIRNVLCENGDFNFTGGALSNFWRSAENFRTTPTLTWNGKTTMVWAVSQGVALRNILVDGNLDLFQYNSGASAGYASGGFLADVKVSGEISVGGQQQFFLRNAQMTSYAGGVWNMFFVGSTGGVPPPHCGNQGSTPVTEVTSTPVIAEKPYIAINGDNKTYSLIIPAIEMNKKGPTTDSTRSKAEVVDFGKVYVATSNDTADVINSHLDQGHHLVLTPGIYHLKGTIRIAQSSICVVGLGYPTLIPTTGQPAIVISPGVDGVRIAGILLEAGSVNTTSLLQWGDVGKPYPGNPAAPGFLYDVFARVGGPTDSRVVEVMAESMLVIHSGNVVVDNAWLWRADHDVGGLVKDSHNPCAHGLVVTGNDVTTYGLASEHQLDDLVLWEGDNGTVYFYQSELPYDVTQANFGDMGYAGFKVGDKVTSFTGLGIGVYSFFRDNEVVTPSGIRSPYSSSIRIQNSLSVYLSGKGGIKHVINDLGGPINSTHTTSYVC